MALGGYFLDDDARCREREEHATRKGKPNYCNFKYKLLAFLNNGVVCRSAGCIFWKNDLF